MLRPVAVVLGVYAVWIGAFMAQGHDVRDFIRIGVLFVKQSHASPDIRFDPHYRYPPNHDVANGVGYDGQFSYYMALDPVRGRHYMDDAPYRYGRVLYPAVAWGLAAGQRDAIPTTMLLVNWLAIGLGTLAIAAWLRRRGSSEWWALAYGLYPGLFVGLQRDLTEPLAYGLAALAVYLFDYGGRHRLALAAAALGLGALARQTVAVFALCFVGAILLRGEGPPRERVRRNLRDAAGFAALSLLPVVAWTAALWAWLGAVGTGKFLRPVPFLGLFDSGHHWQLSRQPVELWAVVLPGLLLGVVAVAMLRRGVGRLAAACVLANVVPFVLLLNVYGDGYTASGRATTGVVLAALMCVPYLRRLPRPAPLLAAFAVWATMFPVIAVYGLTDAKV